MINSLIKTTDVILVDNNDHEIGFAEKLAAHQQGLLHRAFSVFIFRKKDNIIELLLQQRNFSKYHSPGMWTNTCCSHPHPGEELLAAAEQRLTEEMGITAHLKNVGNFIYKAKVGNNLIEHEFDHVVVGFVENPEIHFNRDEVANYRWIELSKLIDEMQQAPDHFSAWLKPALMIVERSKILDN